tara:strand:- start:501 stop:941 length:441 start_codon:yes stop_codon:yes gene_type:complete
MATIEEIQLLWDIDSTIDSNHLDDESVKTSKLHAKYISLLMNTKLRFSKTKVDYNTLRKNKFRYYRGELSKQELTDLGWEQWQFIKPLKNEMDEFLKGDSEITTMDLKIEYLTASIYLLESILKSISDRTWSIKNCITYKAFLAGG